MHDDPAREKAVMARAGANSPGLVHAQLVIHMRISDYAQ